MPDAPSDPTQEIPEPDMPMTAEEEPAASPEAHLIEALLKERDSAKDDYLRTLAEFQNFRRRSQQEKQELRKTAAQDLISDLLPVLDNFERTIAAADSGATLESLMDGVRAIDRQLRDLLSRKHVSKIPTVGEPFDPVVHEPLGTEVTEEFEEDTVTAEIEPGYRIEGVVLRPAKVRVAKRP